MKKLILILAASALIYCSTKEENASVNILENLSFTVDTLLVESGGDILNLSMGIWPYALNGDKSQLWYFERDPYKLVQVDLDQLKVLKKMAFDEEGPDGVGSNISDLEIGAQNELYLKSNRTVGLFGQDSKLVQNMKFIPSGIDSVLARNSYGIFDKSVFDFGTRKIYSHPGYKDAGEYVLLILNPETQAATSLPVPKMKIVDDYSRTESFETASGTSMSFYSVGSDISSLPGQLILSTGAMSGFYRLDIQTEKLEFVDIQHRSFPNSMDFEIIKNPSGPQQMFEIQKKIWEHINYMELLWDDTRQLYFRLGIKALTSDRAGPPEVEYFIFVYDKEFNVVGEAKLDGLKHSLWYSFFKDGKLWSYVNVEDELGFAVVDLKF